MIDAMDAVAMAAEDAAAEAWPQADLESVPLCEVCGSAERERWLDGLTDRIFRAAPGRWTLWRCRTCSAATLDPRPTATSIGRAYSAYYTHAGPARQLLVPGDLPGQALKRAMFLSHYARQFGHRVPGALPLGWLAFAWNRRRSARAAQMIRHLPPPAPGARLLDVGCGNGGFLRIARAFGYTASGSEFDPKAAQVAREQGFEIFEGDWSQAPIAPGSIDQITLHHVIEHLYRPVDALRRMREWLRPGGRIWLQTPNADSRGAQRYGVDWRGLEPPRHLVLFTPTSLQRALEAAGFERCELLPPQMDGEYYVAQSEAIRAGLDPYRADDEALLHEARVEGRRWDAIALDDPGHAESVTMAAWRP